MKRIKSESREPGMQSTRQWGRPELSDQAKAAGEARRADLELIERANRQLDSIHRLIRKMNRSIE
jgi:hypothetical protein